MTEEEIKHLVSEGMKLHKEENFEDELKVWQKLSDFASDNFFWKHNVALALMNTFHYEEALEIFNELIEAYPGLSRAHNNRAILLMRMSVDTRLILPSLILALETSEDVEEFVRHFFNLCGNIAFNLEDDFEEALDTVEENFPRILSNLIAPGLMKKNVSALKEIILIYRKIGEFRRALMQRKWRIADSKLEAAKKILQKTDLKFIYSAIDHAQKVLLVCRNTIEVIEKIGSSPPLEIDKALSQYKNILELATEMRAREDIHPAKRNDVYLHSLLDILGWFIIGMIRDLEYINDPLEEYIVDDAPQDFITYISSTMFTEIGRDLIYFLQFMQRQCITFSKNIESIVDESVVDKLREDVWVKSALFCKSISIDFKEIDIALAKNIVGWSNSPNQKDDNFNIPLNLDPFSARNASERELKQQEILGLQSIVQIKKRRLQILREKQAMLGISVDPSITIEIQDLDTEIDDLENKIKRLDT